MIVLIALIAVLAVLVIVPTVAVTASRSAVRSMPGWQGRAPVEDAATQERLERIEEAIDAMATQIERLAQQQHVLIAGRGHDTPPPVHPHPDEKTE